MGSTVRSTFKYYPARDEITDDPRLRGFLSEVDKVEKWKLMHRESPYTRFLRRSPHSNESAQLMSWRGGTTTRRPWCS